MSAGSSHHHSSPLTRLSLSLSTRACEVKEGDVVKFTFEFLVNPTLIPGLKNDFFPGRDLKLVLPEPPLGENANETNAFFFVRRSISFFSSGAAKNILHTPKN